MKATLRTTGWTALAGMVSAALVSVSLAEKAASLPSLSAALKAMAESGKPGPEHAKLQPLIGDWTFTVRMWTEPAQPPAEFGGTVTRKWIMGGRFVQETAKGEFEGKPFEGMGLWGYDDARKQYTTVRACSLAGTIHSELSDYNESRKSFEWATKERCPVTGEMSKGRDEIVIVNPDKIVMTCFKLVNGKEVKAMEFVSLRKA